MLEDLWLRVELKFLLKKLELIEVVEDNKILDPTLEIGAAEEIIISSFLEGSY
jgi:hypothetical protein